MNAENPLEEDTASTSWLARLRVALRRRPQLGTAELIVVISLLNAALYQMPLFAFAVNDLVQLGYGGLLTLATLFVVVAFVTALALASAALASQHLIKPLCILGAMLNAAALYFMQSYGVLLDKTMMGNVLNTDVAEAATLWHPKLALYLLILGLGPSLLLARVQIRPTRRPRLFGFAGVVFAIGLGWVYAASSTWLWIDKHGRSIGGLILPWSYTINLARYQTSKWAASRQAELLPDASFKSDEKTVVVLVIGESARKRNFSLYGYPRQTNPILSTSGAIPLADTQACATYTTEALLCILSHDDPSVRLAGAVELLPSYLQRHGIDVIWRSNNWGEPPLKVGTYERANDLARSCTGSSCFGDEVLLSGLEQRIRDSTARKVFVVLHQGGSHGPAYNTKAPPSFEHFKPVCDSVELSRCSRQSLINAYDNSILFTDHVVGRAIQLLKKMEGVPTTLLYISDHGESLGEHGLYLHGTPMALAPDVQKEIPFLVWISDGFAHRHRIDASTLRNRVAHSQDQVFHSVMGAFDMRSRVYRPQRDIYAPCSGDVCDR
ncbi:phosphoethanolamine--lipid A transferase EptA [Comamonas sp. SCN 65-56]|uniref:phosphoethanolamine--lipid A transferase EptA n=1 Tax=Comamonas sp. SCN 65-56 TaxID=1660095 RepID=UPI000F9F4778|nr:phosphoethanolamine--lipid A transferase EptA [Comamonas sp. SCN 65-56]RTL32777.1 MAG: phosphoethanolamine--lipid A transferase EptA [Burkholderiales bacterium]